MERALPGEGTHGGLGRPQCTAMPGLPAAPAGVPGACSRHHVPVQVGLEGVSELGHRACSLLPLAQGHPL